MTQVETHTQPQTAVSPPFPRGTLLDLLGTAIPSDHSRQMTARSCVTKLLADHPGIGTVMDLGCGTGESKELFRSLNPTIRWTGLDIAESPEVAARTRVGNEFHTFDGVQIPFAADSFDLVYSRQVFEHVRQPAPLLVEVERVLRPGGWFVGSTSHLEPYHSYSTWNYTPDGFRILLEAAGLRLVEIRPSIDSMTLIVRRLLGRPRFFFRWWEKESPLNRMLSWWGALRRHDVTAINARKLLVCGQFCFVARKGSTIAGSA